MIDTTRQKGLLTELHCINEFTKLGYICLKPVIEGSKYDLIVDLGDKFIKIQCKTARPSLRAVNSFYFNAYYLAINTKRTKRFKYSNKDIDFFYTVINNVGCLIPISDVEGLTFTLRTDESKNKQNKKVHFYTNYSIKSILGMA